jgi:hypothetical protein
MFAMSVLASTITTTYRQKYEKHAYGHRVCGFSNVFALRGSGFRLGIHYSRPVKAGLECEGESGHDEIKIRLLYDNR